MGEDPCPSVPKYLQVNGSSMSVVNQFISNIRYEQVSFTSTPRKKVRNPFCIPAHTWQPFEGKTEQLFNQMVATQLKYENVHKVLTGRNSIPRHKTTEVLPWNDQCLKITGGPKLVFYRPNITLSFCSGSQYLVSCSVLVVK